MLERSRQEYLSLVENSPDAILRFNRKLEHVFVNRRVEELGGIPREEFLGRTHEELGFDPALVELWNRSLTQVIDTGEPFSFRQDHQGPDGVPRHLEVRMAPEFDPKGETSGVQAIVRDLTAERDARDRLRKLTANVPGVVYQFVLDRDGSVRIPLAEGRDAELLGFDSEEFSEDAAYLFDFIHDEDLESVRSSIVHSAASLTSWEQTFRIRHAEHGLRWMEGEAVPERLPDGGTLWHGYLRDVTERRTEDERARRLELRLRRRRKLESLGVLAGGIAHEFNNILMTVMGDAELAVEDLETALQGARAEQALTRAAGEAVDTFRRISSAARQAAALTRQMLHYAGEAPFDLQPVDLTHLVDEIRHLLETSVRDGAELEWSLPDEVPPVRGDPTQLRQAILNLVLNASEALPDHGGEIRVGLVQVACDETWLRSHDLDDQLEPGPYVRLEVQDDGEGMDAETRSRIFEPFFTTRFTGRGLGLASTLGILRGHGGGITVESAPGEGTRFELYLPVAEDAVRKTGPDDPPASG